jgi:short-subunit dehydrogenase
VALPPPAPDSTCLITGASSGIGSELARQLAERGHGVTLVARREERLRALADEISSGHDVRVEVLACDLADTRARERLVGRVTELGLTVEVLANNAGFGSAGRFHELDLDSEIELVHTNVEAVVHLCGSYLPGMVERGRGAVLNVASTAGFQPLARQATYGASKAFVLSFTEVLHSDLTTTGVTASALCPGPVRTEFIDKPGFESADSVPDFAWMSAADVAHAAIRGLERGKRVIVPGALNRIGAVGGQHAPRGLLLSLTRKASPVGRK